MNKFLKNNVNKSENAYSIRVYVFNVILMKLVFYIAKDTNKCNKYICITQTTTWLQSWGSFSSASKMLFCSELAVVIFTMLLADIQRPNSAEGA